MPLEDKQEQDQNKQKQDQQHTAFALLPEGNANKGLDFISKALFSPRQSMLIKAVKQGNLPTWPLLMPENIIKYQPNSMASALGLGSTIQAHPINKDPPPRNKGRGRRHQYIFIMDKLSIQFIKKSITDV
jgi:hypothetical protein